MIDQDKAVRELMKDVGRTLRPMGFRGSVNLWTKVTPFGKVAIGRSNRNNWVPPNLCYGARGFSFGFEAIPEPWWRYQNWRRAQLGKPELPLDAREVTGINLREAHDLPNEPVRPTRLWTIRPESEWLTSDVEFIREHLPWAVEQLAQRCMRLIEPARYLTELLDEEKKEIGDWEPIVVLLSEYGPSRQLETAIDELKRSYAERDAEAATEPIVEYAHRR